MIDFSTKKTQERLTSNRSQPFLLFILNDISHEEHHNDLGDDHSDKHAERIDRGVADARGIAIQRLIGVSQRHRIRHASTEDATNTTEVVLLGFQDNETHDNRWYHGDEEAYAYPHQTFRTNHRLEELSSGIQSQATEIQSQT